MATKNEKIEYALSLSTTAFNRSVKLVSGKMDRMSKDITRSMKRANRSIGTMAATFSKVGIAAAAAAVGGIYLFNRALTDTVGLANEQERAEIKLAGVLRATGNAAGLSHKELKQYASDLQDITAIGDETTLSGMAILATFKQIKGDQFKRATKSALDMSAVLEKDLTPSIMMIGKALNDPARGLSRLALAGVDFSQSQIDLVKGLQKSGDLMGAQEIILKELESQFGAVAEAIRLTFGGAQAAVKGAWSDLKEEIGKTVTQNKFFIDSANLIEKIFKSWSVSIENNRGEWMEWSRRVALAVLEFSADFVNGADKVYRALQVEIMGVKTLAVGTLKLAQGIQYLFEQSNKMFGRTEKAKAWARAQKESARLAREAFDSTVESFDKLKKGLGTTELEERIRSLKKELEKFKAVEVDPVNLVTKETIKEVDNAFRKVGAGWVSYRKTAKAATTGAQEDAELSMDRFKDEWGRTWSEVEEDGKKSVQAILAEIEKLRKEAEKPIKIPITSGHKEGGPIGFNSGGRVPGGWGGGDRIRALLEPGEFVMRKEAVSKWGMGFMMGLNSMAGNFKSMAMASLPPLRMAQGGPVTAGGPSGLIGVDLRITDSAPVRLYGTKQQIMEMQRQKKQMVNRRS